MLEDIRYSNRLDRKVQTRQVNEAQNEHTKQKLNIFENWLNFLLSWLTDVFMVDDVIAELKKSECEESLYILYYL